MVYRASVSEFEIIDSALHSNGSAVPFVVAIVDDASEGDVKLIVMFEDEDYTAVFSLDELKEEDISSRAHASSGRKYEHLRDILWSED